MIETDTSIYVEWKMAKLTLTLRAAGVRITVVAVDARANRLMILCCAASVETARADAWILAALRDTCAIRRTFLVDDALWTAIRRCAKHSHGTRAHSSRVELAAFGVRAARTRNAWVDIAWWFDCCACARGGKRIF